MGEEPAVQNARRVSMSAAAFVLICFFLPWVQVSCFGMKDSVSGFDLARGGGRAFWLIPLLMILVLLLGSVRLVLERMPALFALSGLVGGSISFWLMLRERLSVNNKSAVIAIFWTAWFWLGLIGSLLVAAAALWFYIKRVRAP
jgi:hypothetical protein